LSCFPRRLLTKKESQIRKMSRLAAAVVFFAFVMAVSGGILDYQQIRVCSFLVRCFVTEYPTVSFAQGKGDPSVFLYSRCPLPLSGTRHPMPNLTVT